MAEKYKNKIKSDNEKFEKKFGDYLIQHTIGKGTFGKVKIGIHIPTKENVAIKILEKDKITDEDDMIRIEREMKICKSLYHLNVVKIFEILEDSQRFYIVMELAKGGELFNYIINKRRLNEQEASYFFYQIINGMEYLHKNNIVHRDLKPENLLLTEEKIIKIIDFGLSNEFISGNLLKTPCGSPCYAAPEMVLGKKYSGIKIDIWSTGIILYAMTCGYLPFEDKRNEVLFKKIIENDYEFPNYLTSGVRDMIKKILVTNPRDRATIEDIKNHHFYNQGKVIFYREQKYILENVFDNKEVELLINQKIINELNFKLNKNFNLEDIEDMITHQKNSRKSSFGLPPGKKEKNTNKKSEKDLLNINKYTENEDNNNNNENNNNLKEKKRTKSFNAYEIEREKEKEREKENLALGEKNKKFYVSYDIIYNNILRDKEFLKSLINKISKDSLANNLLEKDARRSKSITNNPPSFGQNKINININCVKKIDNVNVNIVPIVSISSVPGTSRKNKKKSDLVNNFKSSKSSSINNNTITNSVPQKNNVVRYQKKDNFKTSKNHSNHGYANAIKNKFITNNSNSTSINTINNFISLDNNPLVNYPENVIQSSNTIRANPMNSNNNTHHQNHNNNINNNYSSKNKQKNSNGKLNYKSIDNINNIDNKSMYTQFKDCKLNFLQTNRNSNSVKSDRNTTKNIQSNTISNNNNNYVSSAGKANKNKEIKSKRYNSLNQDIKGEITFGSGRSNKNATINIGNITTSIHKVNSGIKNRENSARIETPKKNEMSNSLTTNFNKKNNLNNSNSNYASYNVNNTINNGNSNSQSNNKNTNSNNFSSGNLNEINSKNNLNSNEDNNQNNNNNNQYERINAKENKNTKNKTSNDLDSILNNKNNIINNINNITNNTINININNPLMNSNQTMKEEMRRGLKSPSNTSRQKEILKVREIRKINSSTIRSDNLNSGKKGIKNKHESLSINKEKIYLNNDKKKVLSDNKKNNLYKYRSNNELISQNSINSHNSNLTNFNKNLNNNNRTINIEKSASINDKQESIREENKLKRLRRLIKDSLGSSNYAFDVSCLQRLDSPLKRTTGKFANANVNISTTNNNINNNNILSKEVLKIMTNANANISNNNNTNNNGNNNNTLRTSENNFNTKKINENKKFINRKNTNSGNKVISLQSAQNTNRNYYNSNNIQKDFDSYFKKVKDNMISISNNSEERNNPLRNSQQYYNNNKEKIDLENAANENNNNYNVITESKRNSKVNVNMGPSNFEFKFKKKNSANLFKNNQKGKDSNTKEKYGNYVTLDLFNKDKLSSRKIERNINSSTKDKYEKNTNLLKGSFNKEKKIINVNPEYNTNTNFELNNLPKFSLKNKSIQKNKISLNMKNTFK